MKRAALYTYIILFFTISMIPSVFLVLGFKSPNVERRMLAPEPKMIIEDQVNPLFAQEFDAYFNDHFAFRPYFVSAYACLARTIFHSSVNKDVIIGRDGFLFYQSTQYDYMGQGSLSDQYLAQVCEQLKKRQDALEADGIAFIFMVCPNKNTIYPEYMPRRFPKSQHPSNMSRLYEMMVDRGIHCIDITQALIEEKDEAQLWQKEDTHWNKRGALVAYTQVMNMVKQQLPDMTFRDFTETAYHYEKRNAGDLVRMLYATELRKEPTVVFDYLPTYQPMGDDVNLGAEIIVTTNNAANKRALIMRDSCFEALTGFFAESFNHIEFLRTKTFDFDYALMQDIDIVIVEIVERDLFGLLDRLTQ